MSLESELATAREELATAREKLAAAEKEVAAPKKELTLPASKKELTATKKKLSIAENKLKVAFSILCLICFIFSAWHSLAVEGSYKQSDSRSRKGWFKKYFVKTNKSEKNKSKQ